SAEFIIAAADETDLRAERFYEQVVPLVHQVQCRDDDERRAISALNRHLRDETFARACRKDDDATAAAPHPLVYGLLLVRARLGFRNGSEIELVVGARQVFVRGLGAEEITDYVA